MPDPNTPTSPSTMARLRTIVDKYARQDLREDLDAEAWGAAIPPLDVVFLLDEHDRLNTLVSAIGNAEEIGAWRLAARMVSAIDEERACRKTAPDDVVRLVSTLREWLVTARKQRDELLMSLEHAVSENLAFNVKVAGEINEARRQRDSLRRLALEACDIANAQRTLHPSEADRVDAIRDEATSG